MIVLLPEVTVLQYKIVTSFSVECFNLHSGHHCRHSSEVYDFVKILVGASFQSLHLYCQIPNGEVNLSIWSVNWYCLSTILLAIQVTVNNWNLNPYPILSYYILLNLLKIKKN